MKENNQPIGIFDSGLGGLTVVKELQQIMPKESFVYFGDIKNLPYGNKSPQTILKYSKAISKFLFKQKIKCLIIACNTASAVAFPTLRSLFSIPVYNVIDPCIYHTIKTTKSNEVMVIGTETTIKSQVYLKKIYEKESKIKIISQACPLFVSIVEENLIQEQFTEQIIKFYLQSIKKNSVDTLILGCTHYPLLAEKIQQFIGNQINIISSSKITAEHIRKDLKKNNLLADSKIRGASRFYVSDQPEKFNYLANIFLKKTIMNAKKIILE
tara:strand:- start:1554 stop:2360 length:807 start_codon:yes stop_codon:yes gene_type:complete